MAVSGLGSLGVRWHQACVGGVWFYLINATVAQCLRSVVYGGRSPPPLRLAARSGSAHPAAPRPRSLGSSVIAVLVARGRAHAMVRTRRAPRRAAHSPQNSSTTRALRLDSRGLASDREAACAFSSNFCPCTSAHVCAHVYRTVSTARCQIGQSLMGRSKRSIFPAPALKSTCKSLGPASLSPMRPLSSLA